MEGLQIFEPLAFLFCGICLGDMGVIVNKREEILLSSKAYGCYRADKICVNILITLCCFLLRYSIVPLCGFRFFAAIAHITFSVINRSNIVIGEMFF